MTINGALLWFVLSYYNERSFHVEHDLDGRHVWVVAD
jgi:hypothetical protein